MCLCCNPVGAKAHLQREFNCHITRVFGSLTLNSPSPSWPSAAVTPLATKLGGGGEEEQEHSTGWWLTACTRGRLWAVLKHHKNARKGRGGQAAGSTTGRQGAGPFQAAPETVTLAKSSLGGLLPTIEPQFLPR